MSSADITKKAIADVMKQLMNEKPLAKINVADIVNMCGINRNSFYYHFKDKYDLINWIFYTELGSEFSREEFLQGSIWVMVERVCQFFYVRKNFFRNVLSVSGQNSFEECIAKEIRLLVELRTPELFEDDEDLDFLVTFFLDAISLTIFRWIREGANTTPEKLTKQIEKAATGAAVRLLNSEKQETGQ